MSGAGSRRKHIFIAPLAGGTPKDLTPGPLDVPPFSLGGGEGFRHLSRRQGVLCYVSNIDPNAAFSTNGEIFVVSIEGGEAKKISTSPGNDLTPQYSPDGKYIAWRSQEKAGFEADRWEARPARPLHRRAVHPHREHRSQHQRLCLASRFPAHRHSRRGPRPPERPVDSRPAAARASSPTAARTLQDISFTADGKRFVYVEDTGASPAGIVRSLPPATARPALSPG